MSWLQNSPQLLESVYHLTYKLLEPFRRWLVPNSRVEWIFVKLEKFSKGVIFDCQMCGQCVLHTMGMTCPMTCPKNLRNGPCGGVLLNGHCEIKPEMPCIWVQAWERSKQMPSHGFQIVQIQYPLDYRLQGSSAWINDFNYTADSLPKGWVD